MVLTYVSGKSGPELSEHFWWRQKTKDFQAELVNDGKSKRKFLWECCQHYRTDAGCGPGHETEQPGHKCPLAKYHPRGDALHPQRALVAVYAGLWLHRCPSQKPPQLLACVATKTLSWPRTGQWSSGFGGRLSGARRVWVKHQHLETWSTFLSLLTGLWEKHKFLRFDMF